MEQGKFEPTEEGSAQGSVMSPMLANIYMHHVLTLWFKLVVKKEMLVNKRTWKYDIEEEETVCILGVKFIHYEDL